ncbi:MAG: hypothetical protein IKV97_03785 [Clostridia bacterium]|nr:hypothetical protein [Clostridia bacterium]
MALFGKNKKEQTKIEKENTKIENPDEEVVYRDGVFEVFRNKTDGKKYGRILKYHGTQKVFEMNDDDFEKWQDANGNFSKYRITYERDEEYFIEKAEIELATSENRGVEGKTAAEAPAQQKNPVNESASAQDAEEAKALIDFYNTSVNSQDSGASALSGASLDQVIGSASICDRKLAEFAVKARGDAKPGTEIKVTIPKALAVFSENCKKELFARVTALPKVYVIYSAHTKRQHSAAGHALVALIPEAAQKIADEFASKNQKVYICEVEKELINREIGSMISNGLIGIRFLHKHGITATLRLSDENMKTRIPFPENIAVRRSMGAFFQDLRNGVPAEKLKNAEFAMYEAFFKATFIQPCAKKTAPDGSLQLSVCIIKDSNGNCLLDLFTAVEIMEASPSCVKFKQENPQDSGYKKWTFDELVAEIRNEKTPATGFMVDKEFIPVQFAGNVLENILKIKEVWDSNGGSFVKKQ